MKLPQLKKPKWNYPALAFLFPVIGILVLMMIGGYTPFGSRSMLYSDMWHQYFPFFKAFRQALRSGDSLLYSWNVGMGMDYLGLISYYLASPLNLLSALLPESWVLPYFSLLVPIKLGLASLFFAIFLKELFGKDDFSLVLFGTLYGMCAWALGYQWNVMWLDTFALLPLVALGAVRLLRDKQYILYTVTLFLSIFCNYYIGLFTCIFVLLLFICYQICFCRSIKRFFADLCRIALFSVLAIGMTAILELPALAALANTQSSVNSFPEGFSLNMVSSDLCTEAKAAWTAYNAAKDAGEATFKLWLDAMIQSIPPILDGMRQVAGNMTGGLTPTFKEGLPNLYCGVGSILFAFLFLTSPSVKRREKICCVCLLVFFMLSFIIRQLDYIWHGFHFTNMIPYRFSFLFSFVVLYMAYRAYLMRNRFQTWQITVAGLLSLCIFLFNDIVYDIPDAMAALGSLFGYLGDLLVAVFVGDAAALSVASSNLESVYSEHGEAYVYLCYNAIFFCLYFFTLLYPRLHKPVRGAVSYEKMRELCQGRIRRRNAAGSALTAIIVMELIMNVVNFGVNFPATDISNYPKGTEATASMIRYMQEREDSLFYRTETTHSQTLNDGALNGYNGISTFTSSANVKVTEFMKALGYAAKNTYNRYCFEESSPVANLFLNLKYMLERDGNVEENDYFSEVHHYENVYLLENNAYLPLGFLASSQLANVDFSDSSLAFTFQNLLFTAATGVIDSVWNYTPSNWLSVEGTDVEITSQSVNGYCYYQTGSTSGSLTYTYTVEDSGFLCVDLTMPARNTFYVYLNGELLYSESISLAQTLSVSQVEPGDVVTIRVTCKANESNSVSIRAALLDDSVFWEGYEILAASTLELTSFSNTRVAGTIDCNRDGLMYTSIPQDGNWEATVDGEPAEIILVGDCMIALELTQGVHEIVFTYHNSAFSLGWKISLGCLMIFLAIVVIQRREQVRAFALRLQSKWRTRK
ncbi:MAG: YfhO family protein [Firmicutes bacterium]|nr:YfhO family protein [Bacillota bacterium]